MTTEAILDPADCYHFGLVVPDIEAAMVRLTQVAGYQWTRPITHTFTAITQQGPIEVTTTIVYSVQAPHVELVGEIPSTPWVAAPRSAGHHLGYWVDDIAATGRRLEAAGYALELAPAGDLAGTFAYYIDPLGVRLELVARGLFGDWPSFLRAMAR
jgi:catechol 2,3-dioxygenase-like lactoylglutathione lyase family enzyme